MSLSDRRIVFAGTPEFAASHLDGLLNAGVTPVAVYTQPDRPAGRGKKLQASPVKARALDAGITVMQPASLKDAGAQEELAALAPDLLIVVAYGLILPQAVLDIPSLACINVHASLLPRWRGAAPIQRAIEAGDSATGITIMQMDAGLDTGPMLATAELAIGEQTTAGELHDELALAGAPLLLEVLEGIDEALASAEVQDDSLACYAPKISKEEARIDWQLPADELHRRIRAFNPFPVCWSHLGEQRIKVWESSVEHASGAPGTVISAGSQGITVACGENALRLTRLQLPGGRALSADEVLRARAALFAPGSEFS